MAGNHTLHARLTKMASSSNDRDDLQAQPAPGSSGATLHDDLDSLYITVESPCHKEMQFSKNEDTLLTLAIPNKLLFTWHKEKIPATTFSALVNTKIRGRIIRLKCCQRINERLRSQAARISSQYQKGAYRQRKQVLEQMYRLHILEGECDHFDDIEHEEQRLQNTIAQKDDEIEQILEDMAGTIVEYDEQRERGLVDITNFANRGKSVEDVSPRQARRKVKTFTNFAQQALWFAESFGLVPEYVQVHKAVSGSPLKISLTDDTPCPPSPSPTEDDYSKVQQMLYIVDRFALSDDAYHELSIASNLPPLYRLKQARTALNSSLTLNRFNGPYPGAFRSFMESLKNEISKEKSRGLTTVTSEVPIRVKLSGDGARFSKSSNLILISFSLPGLQKNVLSGSGNHTFAALNAHEDYEVINTGMEEIMNQINALIAKPQIEIDDTSYTLEIILGGDYKFLLLMLGLNQATANYSCVWCHIHRDKRYDMSFSVEHYNTSAMKRTLASLTKCASLPKSRPASQRLGVQHTPILTLDPDSVVIDELHLLLRVGDVLIRNLVWEIVDDNRKRTHSTTPTTSPFTSLVSAFQQCGVCFRVWERKDADGKPSGRYDWTSLMGEDMKKVLRFLPAHFSTLLRSDISETMGNIWKAFYALYLLISSWEPSTPERIHTLAKEWVNLFLSLGTKCEGFQRKNITPYIHSLVYHVPEMIKKYGNIKQFSGQGVEKNNNDAKRNYFSSNLHDATGEVLKAEWRLEQTEGCKRTKRKYHKRDEQYWEEGIREARKTPRV